MSKKRRIIISLGGSLVTPNIIDTAFVKQFKTFIDGYVKKGYQFGIVVGGGSTARNYQVAAKKVTKLERDDLDWLGIHATRINAHYLRTIFKKNAYAHVVTNPTKKEGFTSPVIVASGWKPGWSTDYVAVELAKTYGADIIINLSNVDYLYSKDPKKYKNAKKIHDITWKDFQKIVGTKWIPGVNLPFDPVASKLAKRLGITVVIMNGKNIANIKNFLKEKKFIGTMIQ
jgi:uridylate kinase